jgi:hypothetical protein
MKKKMRGARKKIKGSALVVVLLVLAFLQIVGIVLITVTSTGPKVAENVRAQQQASNAAEAGFDAVWAGIEELVSMGTWVNFDGHYLVEPTGIDDPQSTNYFRKLTDGEILNLIDPDGDNLPNLNSVYCYRQSFIQKADGSADTRYSFTAFLIDDEAGAATLDPEDAILVCIGTVGSGASMTTTRIEVELAIQLPGGGSH